MDLTIVSRCFSSNASFSFSFMLVPSRYSTLLDSSCTFFFYSSNAMLFLYRVDYSNLILCSSFSYYYLFFLISYFSYLILALCLSICSFSDPYCSFFSSISFFNSYSLLCSCFLLLSKLMTSYFNC